jgi:hypothetical protein
VEQEVGGSSPPNCTNLRQNKSRHISRPRRVKKVDRVILPIHLELDSRAWPAHCPGDPAGTNASVVKDFIGCGGCKRSASNAVMPAEVVGSPSLVVLTHRQVQKSELAIV